jgi:hypothetical protein
MSRGQFRVLLIVCGGLPVGAGPRQTCRVHGSGRPVPTSSGRPSAAMSQQPPLGRRGRDTCVRCDDLQSALRQEDLLPEPAQIGRTRVGGMDLNKPRMRRAVQAVLALSASRVGSRPQNWSGRSTR